MLNAREARALMEPAVELEEVYTKVEASIRSRAQRGHTSYDLPKNLFGDHRHMVDWMCGTRSNTVKEFEDLLSSLGYKIEAYGGGHSGSGYVRVSW